MRILMTSNTGAGHIGPLVPFAHAFLDAGHDVLLAAPAQARPTVERAASRSSRSPTRPPRRRTRSSPSSSTLPQEEQSVRVMREIFAGIDAGPRCTACCAPSAASGPTCCCASRPSTPACWPPSGWGAPRPDRDHGRGRRDMGRAGRYRGARRAPRRRGLWPDPSGRRITESPYPDGHPRGARGSRRLRSVHAVRFASPRPTRGRRPDWWGGHEGRSCTSPTAR